MSSPTSRTLAKLREEGWTAQVVERWNPYSKTRLDLFGGIDVLACADGLSWHGNILGVQACVGSSHAARREKLIREPRLATWLAAGGRLEVWSWALQGPRGKRKVWTLRREAITAHMFVPIQAASPTGETAQQQTREAL